MLNDEDIDTEWEEIKFIGKRIYELIPRYEMGYSRIVHFQVADFLEVQCCQDCSLRSQENTEEEFSLSSKIITFFQYNFDQ